MVKLPCISGRVTGPAILSLPVISPSISDKIPRKNGSTINNFVRRKFASNTILSVSPKV